MIIQNISKARNTDKEGKERGSRKAPTPKKIMWEFTVIHKHCGMETMIFGYDFYDACKRANLDATLWRIHRRVYAD